MMNLPVGTKIWIVAGITDMRNGFNVSRPKYKPRSKRLPCLAMSLSFGVTTVARLNFSGLPMTGCAY